METWARICYCSGWCSKSDPTNDHLCELTSLGTRQTTDGKVTGTQFTVPCIIHHESIPKQDALGTQAFRVKDTHNVALTPSVQTQSAWVWSLPSSLPALDSILDRSRYLVDFLISPTSFQKLLCLVCLVKTEDIVFQLWLTISIIKTFDTYFWKPLRK